MIRPIEQKDLPRISALGGFPSEYGRDFLGALALVDEDDVPLVVMGAWSRAEVHMAMDKQWSTPQNRLLALTELHGAMEQELAFLNVGEVVSWFDKACAFTRRLNKSLGWKQSERFSMHRNVRGVTSDNQA